MEGGEADDRGREQGEEESEGGSDSEESFKSEEIPMEDACSHCGLPNHPELVRDQCVPLLHTHVGLLRSVALLSWWEAT